MTPEKTKPMSRKEVMAWIRGNLSEVFQDDTLHSNIQITAVLHCMHPFRDVTNYDRVMGALIHFWKETARAAA